MKISRDRKYLVINTIQVDIYMKIGLVGFSYDSTYCDGCHYLLNMGLLQISWSI